MKKLLFSAILCSLLLTQQNSLLAQPGPGTTGSKATNSDGSRQSSGPGTGSSSSSSGSSSEASSTGTSATATANPTSRNPTVSAPGTITGQTNTTGTNGLSTPDGEGGGGGKSSVTENNGVAGVAATPSEAERGAAPAGASSEPKNEPNHGNQGSSTHGGTESITGAREGTGGSVTSEASGTLPFMIPVAVLIVGLVVGGMLFMKRQEGNKRKPNS